MTIPLAYRIPLPNSGTQGVATADRPLCALTTAYASWLRGEELLGSWKLLSHREQGDAFNKHFLERDVPMHRALWWANSLRGQPRGPVYTTDVGDFTLDPYQMEALSKITPAGGVMALGCGLGKTATSVKAAITSETNRSRIWIICPLNAMPTWERWRPFLSQHFAEVQILSMDSAHKFVGAANLGGVIIFDEVHLLGDSSARRTKSCHAIRPLFDYGLCLTGTLLHGGVEKTLSIMDLAVPGGALFANRWKAGEYFNCLVRKNIGQRRVTALEKPTGPNREAFMRYISRLTVSLNSRSESVRQSLQLPEQTIHTVKLGEPWESLDTLVAQAVHARLAKGEELPHAQAIAHELCRYGLEAKVDWLLNLMDDPEVPVVVFAAYRDSLDLVSDRLTEAGVSYVRVDGDVTGSDRTECERRFQAGEVQVFLGQMDAACTSMNLYRGYVSVAIDHTWKAANYNQALARTCRRGQTRECHHFDLVSNQLQDRVTSRLMASEDFDASLAEWQQITRAIRPQGVAV